MMSLADVITTVTLLVVSCVFLVLRFQMLVKERYDLRAIGMWLFGFTFALAMLFHLPHFYQQFDVWSGINNLAWYLSCVFSVLTVYIYGESCLSITRTRATQFRWVTYGLLATLLVITVTFWCFIRYAPEFYYPGQMIPADAGSWLIKVTMHAYLLIILVPTRIYVRLYRAESVLPTKIRWGVNVAIHLNCTLLLLSRLFIIVFGGLLDLPPLIFLGLGLGSKVMQLLIMFWPLTLLPTRAYETPAKIITYLQKLSVLRNLLSLHRACQQLPVPVSSPALINPLHQWDYFRHTDLCIYTTIITLLDYKRCLQKTPVPFSDDDWLPALLNTCDDTDYQTQVRAYSQLGQSLSQSPSS